MIESLPDRCVQEKEAKLLSVTTKEGPVYSHWEDQVKVCVLSLETTIFIQSGCK